MNRVILGEASIVSSSGFGKEERKGKKKNPLHFSLCTEMKVVTMIALDRELYMFFSFLFFFMFFPQK